MRCYADTLKVVLALLLVACRAESQRPGPRVESEMSTSISPFPNVSSPPSIDALADYLTPALPAADRAEARRLLVQEIFPWQLRGLADHPRKLELARGVYEGVATEIGAVGPTDRLAALHGLARRAAVQSAVEEAMTLAIARYLLDHPGVAGRVARWVDAGVKRRIAAGHDALRAEVAQMRQRVDALAHEIAADPRLAEAHRLDLLHIRMSLGSAESGSFDTAAGPMLDFLREAGATPASLDVH
jgi:hypothetical protein